MHLRTSATGVVVDAPAKLNLFFEVLARRADGFHEVETLVYPVALFDTLFFRPRSGQRIELDWISGSPRCLPWGPLWRQVPPASENLAVRALELLRERAGVAAGASLTLVKRIPSEAGLGGGSSDAAAALAAGNAGWGIGWPTSRLAELAAELGSDVPLFLHRGPSICRGRGERVEPIGSVGNLHFVLVRPPQGLATGRVYSACRVPRSPRSAGPLVGALGRGRVATAAGLFFNRLEAAAASLSPWIERLRSQFRNTDCLGFQMTGSGTCCFGLCRHARHARHVARRLQAGGTGIAFAVEGTV